MDLVFVSLGTRGDVLPLLAVARELERRGHTCELLTNEVHVELARATGVRAIAVSNQHGILRRLPRIEDYLYCEQRSIAEHLAARRHARPTLINCDRYCVSNLVAEHDGLAVIRVHLSPFKLRPYENPPYYAQFSRNSRVLAHVNGSRRELGLSPVDDAFHDEPYVVRHVAAFPEWLYSPPASVPQLHFVDFPLPAEAAELPSELRAFIEVAGRPIAFTYGTANDELERFLDAAERCCRELDVPGVALCPRGAENRASTARLRLFPFLPLGSVLPACRALVHHGGIGTAARALEAGLPQVIVPFGFDQPDNGARLSKLGVAKLVDRHHSSGSTLANAVRELLADAELGPRLELFRQRLRRTGAITRFADLVEANVDAAA